jgi:hypothetical protein
MSSIKISKPRLSQVTTQRDTKPVNDLIKKYVEKIEETTPKIEEPIEEEEEISESEEEPVIIKKSTPRRSNVMTPRTKRLAIDQELKDLNLIPLEKVVIDDNHLSVKYIKAITINGIPILIELDIEALIAVNPDDINVKESINNIPMPLDGFLDVNKLGMDIDGLAIECSNGICTMTRDSNLQPVSKNLSIQKPYSTGSKSLSKLMNDGFELYPIIRFSDLRSNPNIALQNVEQQSKKIRNDLYNKSNESLKETQIHLLKLNQTYNDAVKIIPTKAKELSDTISQLQKFASDYQKEGINEKNMAKYTAVIKNIQERNSLVSELLAIISKLANTGRNITNATNELQTVINALNIDFINLDRDLS